MRQKQSTLDSQAQTRVVLAFAFVLGICGCGDNEVTGEVSGTVTVGGQPLREGTIAFQSKKGKGGSAPIEDGEYSMSRVPVGKYVVVVLPPSAPPPGKPGATKGVGKEVLASVPMKYWDETTSDLKGEVEVGENTANFDLPP